MWPFRQKSVAPASSPKFIYKSGEAYFEMQCKYGHTAIKERQGIVALVVDSTKEHGTKVAIKIQEDGRQLATIKVASSDGGFTTIAETASPRGDRLKPGDLVVWVPMTHMEKLADSLGHHRQGWIGLIVAKIAAESDPDKNQLTILCRY